jgi:hypothetical protein
LPVKNEPEPTRRDAPAPQRDLLSSESSRTTASPVAVPAASLERIPVFVKAAGSASGFSDPSKDRQDSVKDLQKKVDDSKAVRLVGSQNEALIVLEVLARETKRETNGWTAFNGQRQNKSYLTVRLTAGEFSTEFEGESGSKGMLKGYGAAAGKVVKQLDDWVKANRDRLLMNK